MSYHLRIELFLVAVTSILSFLLCLKLFKLLRSNLVWRVNCWFCNNNFWITYNKRNCWTCPNCEQYNGFNKDGDYNKTILVSEQSQKTQKVFNRSPPKNGLCKMCNINQELKVAQLANFVPTSDRKYEEEIEMYRSQLDKAYKLCSPCKKVLQMKLHKEKEMLLGTKLLESRTPEKNYHEKEEMNNCKIKKLINTTSMVCGCFILVLVTIEGFQSILNDKELSISLRSTVEIIKGLLNRLFLILQMKLDITLPDLTHLYVFDNFNIDFTSKMDKLTISQLNQYNILSQGVLGGCICMLQIIGHVFNANKIKNAIIIDFVWTVFMVVTVANQSLHIAPVTTSIIKFLSVIVTITVYKNIKTNAISKDFVTNITASNKKLTGRKLTRLSYNEDDIPLMDTDDDVSLSKFGLHNITDSSNEAQSPFNSTFNSGRCFTPRADSAWSKPKLNNTFCVNSLLTKTMTPSSISETVFAKPSFEQYQKLSKDDSDSDLDESISSLTIGTPKKPKHKNNSIFSLRKFTAIPNFVSPTPLSRRPLISPSKLGHSTSWVAGGYWGSEGERPMFTLNGSRSSSQSSGFESQASSMNQRNIFSHPPSREESVCGDLDRATALLDPLQSCNINNKAGRYKSPQNFSRVSSPVYPQMQYNGHVHIRVPQPRFAHQTQSANYQGMYARQQTFVQNSMFKNPGVGSLNYSSINSFNHLT